MYCRIEEERLSFITRCQKRIHISNGIRTATLAELKEVQNDINADETAVGEGVIAGKVYLPYTFTGGPRYMKIKYMNAMMVVERLGTPDYFLTFTANGQWPEIKAPTHKSSRISDAWITLRSYYF
ncbi:unnamed protein product [Phyllotreta striolata]|uniref:Helitron helicase-like domain-containing protein n=1 Tax=Phyllotreta striolata TaxID=444603 RepID=A0A9N9TKQ7_PHYSR|nr:unnamed protein product [Phyllotreta striolata]